VNATGPYTDFVRKLDDSKSSKICQPSSGVHIVLPDYYRYSIGVKQVKEAGVNINSFSCFTQEVMQKRRHYELTLVWVGLGTAKLTTQKCMELVLLLVAYVTLRTIIGQPGNSVAGCVPTDIKTEWRKCRKSAPVVNAHRVNDPTIWQPGFTLPWQHWSPLNRFSSSKGHSGACRKTCKCIHTLCTSHPIDVIVFWFLFCNQHTINYWWWWWYMWIWYWPKVLMLCDMDWKVMAAPTGGFMS